MHAKIRNYFKYLHLVREDIREEFNHLGIKFDRQRICDYGCGNGITTFGLALESKLTECIGVDLYGSEVGIDHQELEKYIDKLRCEYDKNTPGKHRFSKVLCKLIKDDRTPRFQKGDIV